MKPTIKYTAANKSSKFSTIWYYTNILTDHKNTSNGKLFALQRMETLFDDDTREHFRMALAQVLREEKDYSVRKEALSLLGIYFQWDEIEWTFWLHQKRCPSDARLLETYEAYCKRKRFNNDSDTLLTIIKEYIVSKVGMPA